MKTGVPSLLYVVISTLAIILCFVPFLFLGLKKMRRVNTYWVIGIYWLFNGIIHLPALGLMQSPGGRGLLHRMSCCYTILEAPMVLLAFALAAASRFRRQLLLVMVGFVAGESALITWRGWNGNTCAMITGAGLLLVLAYSVTGLWRYLTRMEHDPFEDSMVFIYAALLFGYGSFLIIYIFSHLPTGSGGVSYNETDSILLYYISLLLSALVTSAGLGSYGLRKKRAGNTLMAGYSSSSS